MSLQGELWNAAMDRLLENLTNHKVDRKTRWGNCLYCGVNCFDVMDDYKAGKELPKCTRSTNDESRHR